MRYKGEIMKRYVGIDIGGTYMKYAIYELDGSLVRKWKEETKHFSDKDDLYDSLCIELKKEQLAFVGVSAPGVIDEVGNVKSKAAPNISCMYTSNIKIELEKRLQVRVEAINDAKAAGYYEAKYGNGKDCESCVVVTLGTGIGGCFCLHGEVIQGFNGFAGELSSLPIGNGKRWCEVASVKALCDAFNKERLKTLHGEEICQLYLEQDPCAVSHIHAWIEQIALGCVSIAVCFNPEVICIGGGISSQAWIIDLLRDAFRKKCERYTQGEVITTKIVACSQYNDSNIAGAIAYALKHT